MEIVILIAIVVVFILIISFMYAKIQMLNKEAEPKEEKLPYIVNDKLLTDKELKFYKSLKPITDKNNLVIMCKVRIADIVSVQEGTKDYIKWFNYIKSKHIDFVVCNSDTLPIYAIEIDDKTHDRADRVKRDDFVNRIFEDKKVKLLRYRTWTNEQLEKDFSVKTDENKQNNSKN